MKAAEVNDYWRRVYKRNYDYAISEVNFNGVSGFDNITFDKGIFAICGLNGAGKTTVISVLKDILGVNLSTQDKLKVPKNNINAKLLKKGNPLICTNSIGMRLKEVSGEPIELHYLDYKKATDILDILSQQNLEEYIEQYDDYFLEKDLLQQLNYIVGKNYKQCKITEIEDENYVIPYFEVKSYDTEYDSLTMGMGEYIIFYFFWVINRIESSGIILLEEPETFLSIHSQKKFMDYIAKRTSELGITTVITTHSPFILERIPKENIRIINRYINRVNICNASFNEDALRYLGLEIKKKGIIYVEDENAENFLKVILSMHDNCILQEYNIESLGGESIITERLKFPYSDKFEYRIIGIYDGDMKNKLSTKVKEELNWKYRFLPGTLAVEEEFKKQINNNLKDFTDLIEIKEEKVISALTMIEGEEYHDWFRKLAELLGIDKSTFFRQCYKLWYKDSKNKEEVKEFIKELTEICL